MRGLCSAVPLEWLLAANLSLQSSVRISPFPKAMLVQNGVLERQQASWLKQARHVTGRSNLIWARSEQTPAEPRKPSHRISRPSRRGCTEQSGQRPHLSLQHNPVKPTDTHSSGQVKAIAEKLWKVAALVCVLLFFTTLQPQHAIASSAAAESSKGFWAKDLLSFVLHIDSHLNDLILRHGKTTYLILWSIVFCETGLVLTPFLPGDSLLFTAGTFAARGSLQIGLLVITFLTSAILGDAVNYAVGKWLGKKATNSRLINKEYIAKTERYFAKHGGRAIVLARFVPIVRTFAPFVAGIGSMAYREFAIFNVAGALLWTFLFAIGGFLFGNLPFVQRNLPVVMIAIVLVSVLPLVHEILEAQREKGKGSLGST